MDNIIATLAERVSPAAMAAPKAMLTNGTLSYAAELFQEFSADADNTKVALISRIAGTGLSCEEFKGACKEAQALADTTDKLSGFVVAADAKGVEKYGPKRRLLNQRLSEAKQLFGTFKREPKLLAELGYWTALEKARAYLSEANIKWDGVPTEGKEARQARQATAESQAALREEMAANPMVAGESMAQYAERIATAVEDKQEEKAINKVVEFLKTQAPEASFSGALRHIEASSKEDIQQAIAYLNEALTLAALGEQLETQE